MFYGDGNNNLLEISNKINKPIHDLFRVAQILINLNLLREI